MSLCLPILREHVSIASELRQLREGGNLASR
jgi:hypothetical protein